MQSVYEDRAKVAGEKTSNARSAFEPQGSEGLRFTCAFSDFAQQRSKTFATLKHICSANRMALKDVS
jgi:hypothetical protein